MKQYISLRVECVDTDSAEVLIAFLSDYPFECFNSEDVDGKTIVDTYMLYEQWSECVDEVMGIVERYGQNVEVKQIEDENWNEQWERESFEPVVIDGVMMIRSKLHEPPTDSGMLDIVISPTMSFGTGHHNTTRMMCRLIHDLRPTGSVLDVGCGTGVLSIVALKCGAQHAYAVDIDQWSAESAVRGAELNGLSDRMSIFTGTVESLPSITCDAVFANINRNIILADIARYVAALKDGGSLIVSGFLTDDVAAITAAAESYGLALERSLEDECWVAMEFRKIEKVATQFEL